MTDTMTSTHGVSLTDAAAAKVRSLLEQEGRDDLRLRLAVQPAARGSSTSCTSTSACSTATAVVTSMVSRSSSTR